MRKYITMSEENINQKFRLIKDVYITKLDDIVNKYNPCPKMKFFVKDYFNKNLVAFNEEIVNGKLRFLGRDCIC